MRHSVHCTGRQRTCCAAHRRRSELCRRCAGAAGLPASQHTCSCSNWCSRMSTDASDPPPSCSVKLERVELVHKNLDEMTDWILRCAVAESTGMSPSAQAAGLAADNLICAGDFHLDLLPNGFCHNHPAAYASPIFPISPTSCLLLPPVTRTSSTGVCAAVLCSLLHNGVCSGTEHSAGRAGSWR